MIDTDTIFEMGRSEEVVDYVYPSGGDSYHPPSLDGVFEEKVETEDSVEEMPPALATNAASGINLEEIRAEFEQRMSQETHRAFENGRQQGLKEEQQAHAAAIHQFSEERQQQATELVANFLHARDEYLSAVEREVVRLSLQVAARILRRESQMDSLLLTGAVRVALGQLAASTTVRLRIPEQDAALWREAIAHLPNLEIRPEIIADATMRLGECMVETGLGTVDLGIRAQLAEIERGFFDRAPGLSTEAPAHHAPTEQQTIEQQTAESIR